MNRNEREQALWHDAYMLAMSQDPDPAESSGWADAAVAQFRRRYQSQLRTANRLSDLEAQLDKISAERREVARDRTLTFQQRQDKQARLRQRAQEISRKIQRIPD